MESAPATIPATSATIFAAAFAPPHGITSALDPVSLDQGALPAVHHSDHHGRVHYPQAPVSAWQCSPEVPLRANRHYPAGPPALEAIVERAAGQHS
jgi:hypothetical protein